MPLALVAINVALAHKLFTLQYSQFTGNNEATLMAIARGIATHPGDLLWWPYWNAGMPFPNTYFPLVPIITAALSRLSGMSIAQSFHASTAAIYCLAPVSLYTAARIMSGRAAESFGAALLYSIYSPISALIPDVRLDTGFWNLQRLHTLVYYGEAGHTAAVAFLPLAALFLYLWLFKRSLILGIAAGTFMALTILPNAFGITLLAMAALSLLTALDARKLPHDFGRLALLAALVYAVISPLVPPSVLRTISINTPTVGGDYRFHISSLIGAAVLAGVCALLLLMSRGLLRALCIFTCLTLGITMLGAFFHVHVLPQSHRYLVAADMALCLGAAFVAGAMVRRMPRGLRTAAVLMMALAAAMQGYHAMIYANLLIRPVDITTTAGYQIARWMEAHYSGQRVMISSTHAYIANVVSDVQQVAGGHEPMLPNPLLSAVPWSIYAPRQPVPRYGDMAVVWLKAFGAHAVSVPGPHSDDYFKPFVDPYKFDGILPELWRQYGTTIYGLPARSASLAHVIPASAVVAAAPGGLNAASLTRYVDALEDPANPLADMQWENRHQARIRATLSPGQVVSVQVNDSPGWRARIGDVPQPLRADGLGLMVIEPACHGPCEVILTYDPLELRVCAAASLAVAIGLLLALARARSRSRLR